MAFNFFDPITAPKPQLPAADELAVWIVAMRLKFSPVGPIESERTPPPSIASSASRVSSASWPQRSSAGRRLTSSSRMRMRTGVSAAPTTISPS